MPGVFLEIESALVLPITVAGDYGTRIAQHEDCFPFRMTSKHFGETKDMAWRLLAPDVGFRPRTPLSTERLKVRVCSTPKRVGACAKRLTPHPSLRRISAMPEWTMGEREKVVLDVLPRAFIDQRIQSRGSKRHSKVIEVVGFSGNGYAWVFFEG